MFEGDQKARADLKPGTLYAASGEDGWIYYGQVAPDKAIGFFRRRDRQAAAPEDILATPVMAIVDVTYPSITRALRSGQWKKLGRYALAGRLTEKRVTVQWPVGTNIVTICSDGVDLRETSVDDPAIQDAEVIAAWDAVHHVPGRLTLEYGEEPGAWHVGGPIWRERWIKEELARRSSEPWHQLPDDWVPTSVH